MAERLIPTEQFRVTTGANEYIQEKVDAFFNDVLSLLGYNERATLAFTERRRYVLGFEEPNGFRASDDFITFLVARNRAIASALERRDDFNYVEVTTASYLTPEVIRELREGVVTE